MAQTDCSISRASKPDLSGAQLQQAESPSRPVLRARPGRPALDSLPLPSPKYDLARVAGFETAEKAADEDRKRARGLRRQAAAETDASKARRLLRLADRIDPEVTLVPTTPASSRFMRDQRRRVIGALLEVVDASNA